MFDDINVSLLIVESGDLYNASGESTDKFKSVYVLLIQFCLSIFLSSLNTRIEDKLGGPNKIKIDEIIDINIDEIEKIRYLVFLIFCISFIFFSIIFLCSFSFSILLGIDFFVLTINDFKILLSSNAVSFFGEYLANFTKSALLNTSLKLAIVSSEIFILLFFFKRFILSIN